MMVFLIVVYFSGAVQGRWSWVQSGLVFCHMSLTKKRIKEQQFYTGRNCKNGPWNDEIKEIRRFMDSEKVVGFVDWRVTNSKLWSKDCRVRKLKK